MENKIIKKGFEVQGNIINGVVKSVGAIKTTLGPSGRGVAIIDEFGSVNVTRDGATVAKSIQLSDKEERIGSELVKKAASMTEDQAGDGTSTCSILIEELCKRGQRAIALGVNVNELKSGMLKAGKWMENYIKSNSIAINGDMDKIEKVATISANNDPEVGKLVVKALEKVGINGLVTADLASGLDTVVDITEGMKLNRGWSSPQYITSPEDGKCILDNPYILVLGERISSVSQMYNFLEIYQKEAPGHPLLIVCDDIDDNVNAMFIINNLRGAIRCCVVKGIDYGDARKNLMADIAVSTGAIYINPEEGLDVTKATMDHLGKAERVVVSRDSSIILRGQGNKEDIKQRADILKRRLEDPDTSDYDKTKYEQRLANLVGGVAIIRAGGASETEKQNRKDTIEDSILAAKSAVEEGCCPGGGYIFFNGSRSALKDTKFLKTLSVDEKYGANIVFEALPIILKTIAKNAGISGNVVLAEQAKTKKQCFGFNAKKKKFVNLLEDGILDSAKVLRISLENSISTAAMILLIDCTITDEPKSEESDHACSCGM